MNKFKIKKILVDEIPPNCGECWIMRYANGSYPICSGLPDDINELTGNPCDMNYRRSDCPLELDKSDVVSAAYISEEQVRNFHNALKGIPFQKESEEPNG